MMCTVHLVCCWSLYVNILDDAGYVLISRQADELGSPQNKGFSRGEPLQFWWEGKLHPGVARAECFPSDPIREHWSGKVHGHLHYHLCQKWHRRLKTALFDGHAIPWTWWWAVICICCQEENPSDIQGQVKAKVDFLHFCTVIGS